MVTTKRRLMQWVSETRMRALQRRPRSGLRILLYHSVGGRVPSDTYGLSVDPRDFHEQMQWLSRESGHAVVGLEQGLRDLRRGVDRPLIAVTFDDGYRDTLTVAAPVLRRMGIPFTVFVTSRHLEMGERGNSLYLGYGDITGLCRLEGVTIGAHGYSHSPLTRLMPADLRAELVRSKQCLEAIIGRPVTAISYPHGAVNRLVRREARSCGYEIGATSMIGVNTAATPGLAIRRTEIVADDGVDGFRRKVLGAYDWYAMKQRIYWPVPRLS
jgi:peptidoglycan/xylan/chitin deacetylase (PgdA/CDA1 family)